MDSRHPIPRGSRVAVYNQALNGRPLLEGYAIIVKLGDVADLYFVRFDGERGGVMRFVYPGEPQVDPETYIATVEAEWRSRSAGAIYCQATWPGIKARDT